MSATRLSSTWLACLVLIATAITVTAAEPVRVGDGALIEATLLAAGGQRSADLDEQVRRIEGALADLRETLRRGKPTYHKAWRLHRLLHRRYLREYVAEADSVARLVDRGEFNCASGTLFFGLAARGLGYDPFVVESPGHLSLGLVVDGELLQIEVTLREGFDVRSGPHVRGIEIPAEERSAARTFTLEQAVGFLWLNSARRALEGGDALRAARHAVEAQAWLPAAVARAEGVHRLLSRAFMTLYEVGRFDDAFDVARVGARLFPESTTSRDRLLAVTYKRVEAACEVGDPARAVTLLDELRGTPLSTRELGRLEIETNPIIAAAAIREGDWPCAVRAADRYARFEPDKVEAARLREWVDARIRLASGPPRLWP